MLTLYKILKIEPKNIEEVYDIHHNINENSFLDSHPNLVAESAIISNCGRHAGGVVITANSREGMPLIKSSGELQTPWPEGVNYRHLEEFGLLKFDILGLGTLRMFEECIRKILVKQGNINPTFKQIKNWFTVNLHPDNCAFDDINVYKHVFWEDRCVGIFQFVQDNTRKFMTQMKPKSIEDIAIATSIFRPGPLSLGVDKKFLANRKNPDKITYKHPLQKEVFETTSGCLVGETKILTSIGEVNIEDIVLGNLKLELPSFNEKTNEIEQDIIEASILTGEKETYLIETEMGTIELTGDHIVYTRNGQKRVDELTLDDELLSII